MFRIDGSQRIKLFKFIIINYFRNNPGIKTMKLKLTIGLLILISVQYNLFGQKEAFTVHVTPFSSDKYDEFCPVYYKNGLVYCTNRKSSLFVDYSSSQGIGPVKINFVDTSDTRTMKRPGLFSKDITTNYNDGPVTFNSREDTIYYSRNLLVEGNIKELSSNRNKLGIFSAVFESNKWTNIRELRFNTEWYNISTPWISPDGSRLYFASDKPDGYGGTDLYYCRWEGTYWADPENLGPVINTNGNEAYPFINSSGDLFFSSDGHPGYGGKDIFFSRMINKQWQAPVLLPPPINSQFDDFGIITDALMNEGYFSSNRGSSIDIYKFISNFPQVFYNDTQLENQYCFRFTDSGAIDIDTTYLRYMWDFGDGRKASGSVVDHCYDGPGDFNVKLDIVDKYSGILFFNKLKFKLALRDFEQPYINSPDLALAGELVNFDGLKSYYPGYKIENYYWDFGDGSSSQGEGVRHIFKSGGDYTVKLVLTLQSIKSGDVRRAGIVKKITVFNDNQERKLFLEKNYSANDALPDIRESKNVKITELFSAEKEFLQDAVFQVELLTNVSGSSPDDNILKRIPKNYALSKVLNPNDSSYSYIIDQQINLMATYPAFRLMISEGLKNVMTRLVPIMDPAEKELYSLIKTFGTTVDLYFDEYNRFTSNAYIMLDQVVKLMNKYPRVRLEIGVHGDNEEPMETSLRLSQNQAQLIVSYLVNRGISLIRLIGKGYGGTRPVALNSQKNAKKLNKRIDFLIIRQSI